MFKRQATILTTILAVASVTAGAKESCETLGPRYYQLAQEAIADYDDQKALRSLQHAANACPEYRYWQELGELAAEMGDPETNELAAGSFRQAYETLAQTDAQKARSAREFARLLLYADNNPKQAELWIFQARRLAPNDADTEALFEEVTAAAAQPTADDIVRGFFSDLAERGPKLQQKLELDGADLPSGGGAGKGQAPMAIDYELVFYSNSTELYEQSQALVEGLASALAADDFKGRQFVFVGHADSRGDDALNMRLSTRRADAVRDLVIARSPALAGRISTQGKGELEPRDAGTSEAALRRNRRVQIWMY